MTLTTEINFITVTRPLVEVFALLCSYIPLTPIFIQWVNLIPCVYLGEIVVIFMIVRSYVKPTNFPKLRNLLETPSQWIRDKRGTGRVKVPDPMAAFSLMFINREHELS